MQIELCMYVANGIRNVLDSQCELIGLDNFYSRLVVLQATYWFKKIDIQ